MLLCFYYSVQARYDAFRIAGFISTRSKYWFLKFNVMLEMKNQVCVAKSYTWYTSVSMFKYVFILESGYGMMWNVLHVKWWLSFAAVASNNENTRECTDIYLPLAILLLSWIGLSAEFFQLKKDIIVKLLIPQIFTLFFSPKDFFSPTHKAFFYPVNYSVCFSCRKITSFSTVMGSMKALMPESFSTHRCSIIPLPVCCGAGLGTRMCLAQ